MADYLQKVTEIGLCNIINLDKLSRAEFYGNVIVSRDGSQSEADFVISYIKNNGAGERFYKLASLDLSFFLFGGRVKYEPGYDLFTTSEPSKIAVPIYKGIKKISLDHLIIERPVNIKVRTI